MKKVNALVTVLLSLFFIVVMPIPGVIAALTDDFVIRVNTGYSATFIIPTIGSGYNYDVDWDNNGTWDITGATGSVTCNYAVLGIYTIRIRGAFPRIYFNYSGDRYKILSVEQWGTGTWTSMSNAFSGCADLIINATDIPDLSNVADMSYMFRDATSFNQPIGNWNTSNVTNMRGMLWGARSFNQAIGNWDTSKVTDMSVMFDGASAFNQDVSNWDTSQVKDMRQMFSGARTFNQVIGNWNTTQVTDMSFMFFGASEFNQDINNWNTSNVTSMACLFYTATSFNQDLSNWNTNKVTTMQSMFSGATAFDQNISTWSVINLRYANTMFEGVVLSSTNYDSLLVGWNGQAPPSYFYVTFDGGNSKYFSAEAQAARANLISTYNWTITDGGLLPPTPTATPTLTDTATITETTTETATPTITQTSTITPTITLTYSFTLTPTPTATIIPSFTFTPQSTINLGHKDVVAFPNPSHGIVHFAWAESSADRIKINVFNLSGERIATLIATTPGQSLDWNAAGVAPGIYIYRVTLTVNGAEHQLPMQKLAIIRP
jgi:surface protein